ncbi:unnamed protein product, partial [Adineta steineri]
KSQYCKQKVLCRSLAGNFVYMLTITSPPALSPVPEQQLKKGVVISARVHPGETNSSWMMKGLLDFLLSDSADAKLLRDTFVFKIIPMLNPDGVIVGNYRCSLSGRDLNRNYKTILKDAYPTIWHTREMIKRFMTEIELVLYCDFHGHSRKQNVFIYGCENKHLPKERLKERIFPAMFGKNDISKFSYDSCRFKVQKSKEGTGRVVMWSMGIKNSYTLEATFCGSTQSEQTGHQFTTRDFESIGYHFLDSLLDYSDPDPTKRNRIFDEIENDLRQSIRLKLLSRGINPTSLSDIDLDQFSSDEDSSDDAGSDSSADDGLPKHLEVIAAAKVRLKKPRKQPEILKVSKELNRKDDKENIDKNKTVTLTLTSPRKPSFPNIVSGYIISRTREESHSDDGRQYINSYVTNRVSVHLNERLIGPSRPAHTPKSPTISSTQNHTVLDVRAIQPPIQTANPRRILEQQQHQRQRVMVVFGKQGSAESVDKLHNFTSNPLSISMNERKIDDVLANRDDSSATLSKLIPKQLPDGEPINIVFRCDPTPYQQATLPNRPQVPVRLDL